MNPPYPICPTCKRPFSHAGIYQPRRDGRDVVAYFHNDELGCDDVWATIDSDVAPPIVRLGSTDDYSGDTVLALIEGSTITVDLRVP